MDGLDEIKEIFFVECDDLLSELNGKLADVEQGSSDAEDLNAIFRAVHSIKGGAGSFGLDALIGFAHTFENVLDLLRSGSLELDDDMIGLLMSSADVLADLVQWSQEGADIDPAAYAPTLDRLEAIDKEARGGEEDLSDFVFEPVSLDLGDAGMGGAPAMDFSAPLPDLSAAPALDPLAQFGPVPTETPVDAQANVPAAGLQLKFTPSHDLAKAGLNCFRLLDDLRQAGATDITLHADDVPAMDAFDPETVYVHWTMTLPPALSRDEVEDVLFFALDKLTLEFLPLETSVSEGLVPEAPAPESLAPAGKPEGGAAPAAADPPTPADADVLAAFTAPPAADLAPAPVSIPKPVVAVSAPPLPDPMADAPKAAPSTAKASVAKTSDAKASETKAAAKTASAKKAPPATIRVVLDKIDRLINQVGELVVTQAMLDETISEAGLERDPNIMSTITDFRQLTVDIQESVMAIRAQPIRSLFQRMGRVVRESAQAVNKNAKLVLEGEYTEVDNTIIESLADPLMHMLRNAVDHGLEDPDGREAAGKPKQGLVTLSAAHRGGKVVIEVRDDGAGINRPKVLSIAQGKGLVEPDANLSDAEIDNLLFMPGFSTADNVSTLSGRGVGMDVVKRSIMDIGGKVSIRSKPGEGSTITITLPLTLAILDGMLIRLGGETMVVPLTSVVETILVQKGSIHPMADGGRMVDVRGNLLPLIDLGARLGFQSDERRPDAVVAVIVEADGELWCALEVDAILDQRQVVIKSLEENFGQVAGISAATILGDGRLALIVDTEQLSGDMIPRIHIDAPASDREKRTAHG
ncbi:MAG: chemotaxis protein CheA [Litorimonas sp.]